MTENEAIEYLKRLKEDYFQPEKISSAFDVATDALKEIQKYRAAGTIEFLTDMKSHYVEVLSDLRQYQKIGIVEGIKDIGWIPCHERLPEEPEKIPEDDEELEDMYLSEKIKEYIATIKGASKATTLHYVGENKWIDISTRECYEVVAWQQLPEPYKNKRNEVTK